MKGFVFVGVVCAALLAGCERNNPSAPNPEGQQLNQDRGGIIAPSTADAPGTGGTGSTSTLGELPAGGAPQPDAGTR